MFIISINYYYYCYHLVFFCSIQFDQFFFLLLLFHHTASLPINYSRNTHRWCHGAVIRKTRSAWLEGTPAMDLGHMNVVLK